MQVNEAEEIFADVIREKKRETASLRTAKQFKRKSRIFLPTDLMSRKEKLKHTKAGAITVTNIFDTILDITEFEELEKHEQKNRLQYWRIHNTNKEICAGMNISIARLNKMVKELDLPKAPRTNRPVQKREGKKKTLQEMAAETAQMIQVQQPPQVQQAPVQEIIVNGIHLVFNGTHKPEHIQTQLLKFASLLDNEQDNFYIELKLMQKAGSGTREL